MALQIVRSDITIMDVDAIVNPANPLPEYGAGIDAAVYKAAGVKDLLEARSKIGEVVPGQAFVTDGFKLPAKYIIHTVGAPWQGGALHEEDTLRACYRQIFKLALERGVESLAIPLLGSGSYGFPKGIALRIALSEIYAFLGGADMSIFLVVFDKKSYLLSAELYGDIDAYICENYVEDTLEAEYGDDRHRGPRVRYEMAECCMAPARDYEEDADFEPCEEEAMLAAEPEIGDKPRSLDEVVKNLDKTFMELVYMFADRRGLTDAEVQRRANIDRKAYSKLKCGTTKNPSKSTALALAVALELNIDETKDLLSRAGLALSPCSKGDLIVQYFIERGAYDIYQINVALFEHGEKLLGAGV